MAVCECLLLPSAVQPCMSEGGWRVCQGRRHTRQDGACGQGSPAQQQSREQCDLARHHLQAMLLSQAEDSQILLPNCKASLSSEGLPGMSFLRAQLERDLSLGRLPSRALGRDITLQASFGPPLATSSRSASAPASTEGGPPARPQMCNTSPVHANCFTCAFVAHLKPSVMLAG